MHRAAALLDEERLQVGRPPRSPPVRRSRAGSRSRARSTARRKLASTSVVGRLARGIEEVHVAPDHLAVADDEQRDRGLVVLRAPGRPGRARSGRRRPSSGSPSSARWPGSCRGGSPRARSPAGPRRPLISRAQRLDERLLAALEEQLDLLDVGAVIVLRDRLDARALAALDVVQQARPLERPLPVLDVDRAGPEREQPSDEVHRLVDAGRRGVRPEVPAPVVDQLPGPFDAREVVGQRDLDVRVALVVLQADVEARLEPLDEVVLEEERLADAIDLGDLDVGDAVDDAPDPVDLRPSPACASASSSARGAGGSGPCRRTARHRARPSADRRPVDPGVA